MKNPVDIRDLDVIYLTYDEPQREEFWLKIVNAIPWAKRVDGVYGSDAAHKAAANISETDRFILIDGDNLPDFEFFDQTLNLDDDNKNVQFRWRARNHINGLLYGNGGLSCWTKEHVLNMRSHENSDGSAATVVEFCFDDNYWPMYDCYSTTYPNHSAKQAFRAGFREGVKMCLREGKRPTKENFADWVWQSNKRNLIIWQTVGRDVKNGFYAILGARLGTHYLMLREWDYVGVRDFNELDRLWELHKNDDSQVCKQIGTELKVNLSLDIVEIEPDASRFIKDTYANDRKNLGVMVRENLSLLNRKK